MAERGTVQAVVFDVGGVLERVGSPEAFTVKWKRRLGMTDDAFDAATGQVDRATPSTMGPAPTASAYRQRWVDALGLSESQGDEFMRDLWDWYCGELDTELMGFAASLRPRYATAILSNSGPGAREEEEARYGFSNVFDPIVYSHEVGLVKPDRAIYALTCDLLRVQPHDVVFLDDTQVSVDGANAAGMTGVLHVSTPESIRTISALLG
jgi:HAD superfamily hydrolase (TIGR01509 family)